MTLQTYSKQTATFRLPHSLTEAIEHCTRSSHVWFLAANGTAKRAKINGKVRTWKRNPQRVEVSLKYGLYEHYTFNAYEMLTRLLIEEDAQ